jgi:hypothetical protein
MTANATTEILAKDAFIDAMRDIELALKVREREPETLDEAYRIALRLEAYQVTSSRYRDDHRRLPNRVRCTYEEEEESVLMSKLNDILSRVNSLESRQKTMETRLSGQAIATTTAATDITTATASTSYANLSDNPSRYDESLDNDRRDHSDTARQRTFPRNQPTRQGMPVCYNCGIRGHCLKKL